MTADERLALIRVKIERAKEHIADLDSAITSFFNGSGYEIQTKDDPNTGEHICYLTRLDIPTTIAAIAGDAVHNLRSALDHLACQLFMVATGALTVPRRIEFPIADDPTKFKDKTFRRKIEGLRQDAIKAIDGAEPYKAGKGDALWRLHTLDIIDKHRALNLLVLRRRSGNLTAPLIQDLERSVGRALPKIDVFFLLADAERLRTLQIGDEVDRFAPNVEVNQNMYPRLEIAFGEPQIVEAKSVLETLQHMTDLVDNLIGSFKPLLV